MDTSQIDPKKPVKAKGRSDNIAKPVSGKAVKAAADKRGRTKASKVLPEPAKPTERVATKDELSQVATNLLDLGDRLVANYKLGNNVKDIVMEFAGVIREAAMIGIRANSNLSDITADTPDEALTW
jgi:hypothetical protein